MKRKWTKCNENEREMKKYRRSKNTKNGNERKKTIDDKEREWDLKQTNEKWLKE